jgi:membrane fusion protein, heavy metal efflux system
MSTGISSGPVEPASRATPPTVVESHSTHPPIRPAAHPAPRPGSLRRGAAGFGFLALGGLAWWWLTTHHFADTGAGHAPATDRAADAAPARDIVLLSADAAARSEIALVTVESRRLREHLTVPGRLDYDARHRIDYTSPVTGIVSRMFVKVRQKVTKGDSLAEVSSPEVGMARDDLRKREADLAIEQKAAVWATTIAENVEALLSALDGHPPLAAIEKEFDGRLLGVYREKILGAYSRLVYVEKVSAGTRQLGDGGVLSGRIIEERTSNLEVAKASFAAACEESRFQTRQDRARAQAALEQAERLVRVSKENLRTLVGSRLDAVIDTAEDLETDEAGVSTLALRTPFDGVVEEVYVSRGERVQVGGQLFVVADTSILWVRAQIHEKQWTTVDVAAGQEVRVVVPGAAEHSTTARINHVGSTVEADSRSVPLVAELENDDAHYKPGMFVWVDLPQGEAREGLAVPEAAVMRHEGRAFVFTPAGEGRYRKVDIEAGVESDGVVEVKRGLEEGQQVVAKGAFLLKSELLLEDEG